MLRVKITSDFFSCDIRMSKDKKIEDFLKEVRSAWNNYKWHAFGNLRSDLDFDQKMKISDDILTIEITPWEW